MQIGEGKNGGCIVSFISEHRERDFMHDGNRSSFLNKITKWPVMFVCSIHNKLIHTLCVHKTRSLTTWSAWNLALCMSLDTWKAQSICIQQTIHKVTTGSHKSRICLYSSRTTRKERSQNLGLQISRFQNLGLQISRSQDLGFETLEVAELEFRNPERSQN